MVSTATAQVVYTGYTDRGDSLSIDTIAKCVTIRFGDEDREIDNISIEVDVIEVADQEITAWRNGLPCMAAYILNGEAWFCGLLIPKQ